ncbi:MAG: universal stress protein [Pseudomonadota bacterium]
MAADLSARSEYALARACRVAHTLQQPLEALHVVDKDLNHAFRQQTVSWAKQNLEPLTKKIADEYGVACSAVVAQGRPRQTLIERANDPKTSLLVFGVHDGAKDEPRAFAKTTAGQALAGSIAPALLVHEKPDQDYRNVVVGIDFTLSSRAAIRQALTMAPEAKIHLVHAYHAPFIGLSASPGLAEEIAYQHKLQFDKFVADEMAILAEQAEGMGAIADNLHRVIEAGAPDQVLRRVCDRVNADLVVLATHGRGAVSRAIWGSVAASLLDKPPCDVLVIKPF